MLLIFVTAIRLVVFFNIVEHSEVLTSAVDSGVGFVLTITINNDFKMATIQVCKFF